MSISDLYLKSQISTRILEEELYAEVLREIESGIRRDGLWAKAFAKSGSEERAKALYIEFRVQSLRDELTLYRIQQHELQEKAEKAKSPITSRAQSRGLVSKEVQQREERIRSILREKLGREPTAREIDIAKWDGMCS